MRCVYEARRPIIFFFFRSTSRLEGETLAQLQYEGAHEGNQSNSASRQVQSVRRACQSVRRADLSEERDLLDALVPQFPDLPQDGGERAGALAAPGEGDDAVGAHVVAPAHDADECGDRVPANPAEGYTVCRAVDFVSHLYLPLLVCSMRCRGAGGDFD
jgi:hypothetical protein